MWMRRLRYWLESATRSEALREEMTLTLEDMVMRRTCIGQFGPPDPGVVEKVAALMAARLGWDQDRKQREVDGLARLYRTAA